MSERVGLRVVLFNYGFARLGVVSLKLLDGLPLAIEWRGDVYRLLRPGEREDCRGDGADARYLLLATKVLMRHVEDHEVEVPQ